ncbi:MAG: hypothetical protein F6K53_24800 [Moorea sp. SIO4A1]|nr:hypothetical protein [Moorena sp. SIO4A1]NEQ60451.1 hypothetical protein [Moorena sp. SIO4A1]
MANRPRDRVQLANLGLWPRYANSLQPCPIGHATRTTFNFEQIQTLVKKY